MRGPYGFEMNEACDTCKVRANGGFCNLSPTAMKAFDHIKSSAAYPAGAVLFLEKQDVRGVFVLCQGEVKLSISSSEGKTLILRIAKAGEVLGLMPALTGLPYEATAETLHPCQIAFVRRDDFLRFLAQHGEAFQGIVKQLGASYRGACEQLRTLGLSASAPEKLAKLLLDWAVEADADKSGGRIRVPLTHEQIAEFIGTSRETVTRALSDFRNRRLVTTNGSTLTIENREALEHFVTAA
jgi:CRP/FNR family transcriptional regulator, cyclic AMP receptor protein